MSYLKEWDKNKSKFYFKIETNTCVFKKGKDKVEIIEEEMIQLIVE